MLLLPKVVRSPSFFRKLTPARACGCEVCRIAWSGWSRGQSGDGTTSQSDITSAHNINYQNESNNEIND